MTKGAPLGCTSWLYISFVFDFFSFFLIYLFIFLSSVGVQSFDCTPFHLDGCDGFVTGAVHHHTVSLSS